MNIKNNNFNSPDDLKKYCRRSNTLFTKYLYLPLAIKISFFLIKKINFIRPYQISLIGLIFGFISAYNFFNTNYYIGSIFFFISITFDFVDGLYARATNDQTTTGIIFDMLSDILVVLINSLALIASKFNDQIYITIIILFLLLNYIESWVDFSLYSIFKNLKKQKKISLSVFESRILNLKKKLESSGLRTIFFSYQERYLLIFIIAPILNEFINVSFFSLILQLFFLIFKIKFDYIIFKNFLINNKKESLKFRDNFYD
tara:strand:- start:14 stop:790 length:777 start_codon:yes stop_codon:yes gene_type:complete